MQTLLLPLFGLMAIGSASLSYPVFGTKRYTRANLLPANDYGSSLTMPVYSPVPQYYDNQPQYMPMPSYSMGPAASDYYDDSGYYNSNYYYVPPVQRRHQRFDRYPSYGLPTFQGEYKPTPYYYAHAPSYSYSDDRESNNPLDDLHEEMLQEDERERARDFMPVGQEQWYESPSRHPADNAFLRNLIMYNNQMNSLRNKQFESNEDYEEYEDTEPEYYDTPYADSRNSYSGYVNPYTGNSPSQGSNTNNRNMLNKITSLRNSMAKNAVEDDEEVQELKSLIHQQKNSRPQQQQQQQQLLQQPQFPEQQTPSPVQDFKQHQQRSLSNDYQQYPSSSDSWQRDSPSYSTYSDYDSENEYDDSWSHWDRKRNVQPKKLILPVGTTSSTTTHAPLTTTTTTVAPTEKPKVEIVQGRNGQKEVVLPRPAAPVRNPFANMAAGVQQQHTGFRAATATAPASTKNNAVALQGGQVASPAMPVSSSNNSVYDTIKKIINMQQNLQDADLSHQLESQRHKGTRVHKRFVSTAESLVQQLDGLKRTA
ncbi:probable serine/threonine-protein kinase tsuA [Aedes albopictus]|uniref:Uncharacterized protein n=1 Tax=Aedes albopictus TaxID=7160 RepID=A0ABM1ZC66_AEDAL|nr:probable serine/threonine-protein kinase tsuA [Aedes albopictus]